MAKSLNDILKSYSDVISGKKSSTTTALTTGNNPGVDYADKMQDTRDFIAQHSVEKFDDRVGNGPDVYQAANVKKAEMKRHGHEPKPKDIKVYNKTQQVSEEKEDMSGKTCKKCKKGKYVETSQHDDMKGVLHCSKCGSGTKRWALKEAEELDEADLMHIKVGEKVRLTNPKAPARHTVTKIRGQKVHIKKESGEEVILPLERIKRVKAQAAKLQESKDEREYGYEGDMAITQLKTICRNAEHLMKMMKPDTDLPEWVQSKITKAEDYISTAHDYLMSEMNEEVETLDEGYDKSSAAHAAAKKLSNGWKKTTVKPEYHDDGTASIYTRGFDDVSSTTIVDHQLKNAGGTHNYSEKKLANHRQKIGKLNFHVKKTEDGHTIHIKEQTILSEAKCNMSEAGTVCEVHGKKACPKEDSESAQNKETRFTGKKKEGLQLITDRKKELQEKLTKKTPLKKIISDFENSEDSRFKGDSKEKRKERALGAWYQMHQESFLDQRSKKSTRSEEASKKMASEISKEKEKEKDVEIKRKEKLFDSDLRKQEMVFSHKLKNKNVKTEQAAPAETVIRMPSGEVGDTGRV